MSVLYFGSPTIRSLSRKKIKYWYLHHSKEKGRTCKSLAELSKKVAKLVNLLRTSLKFYGHTRIALHIYQYQSQEFLTHCREKLDGSCLNVFFIKSYLCCPKISHCSFSEIMEETSSYKMHMKNKKTHRNNSSNG